MPIAPTQDQPDFEFIISGNKLTKKSTEFEIHGHVHGDRSNVPQLHLPVFELKTKFAKAKSEFYVLSSKFDNVAIFKFLDA